MRRIIIMLVAFLVAFGVAAGTYHAYNYHDEKLEYTEITSRNHFLTEDGEYIGLYKCNLEGKHVSGYDFEIEDNILYITILANAGDAPNLAKEGEEFAVIQFDVGDAKIEKIYYRYGSHENLLKHRKIKTSEEAFS